MAPAGGRPEAEAGRASADWPASPGEQRAAARGAARWAAPTEEAPGGDPVGRMAREDSAAGTAEPPAAEGSSAPARARLLSRGAVL